MKTVTITISEDNLKLIDQAAEKARQSRSGFMEIAAAQKAKSYLEKEE